MRKKRSGALVLVMAGLMLSAPQAALSAKMLDTGYAGLEFYGSSQISRQEIEKELGLKPGASPDHVAKAAARLQQRLQARHLKANVDVARDTGREYVTVDVMDTGVPEVPTRKLYFPRHIQLTSDVPFQTFDELMMRREQLAQEGRAVTESYDQEGLKHFSDEPCNQFGEKLHRQVPAMRSEFLSVIASDPDPVRRSKAIEVLNWGDDPLATCAAIMPAINDASERVRASAARFIYPRIRMMPADFPFVDLVESFSKQLARPSHMDRSLALRCLVEIGKSNPQALLAVKEFDQDKLKELSSATALTTIREPADLLLSMIAHMPERPRTPHPVTPINEF